MSRKIYIAGQVTGNNFEYTKELFRKAEGLLTRDGFEVLNPITIVNNENCPWDEAMRKCITALMSADLVFMLKGWEQSRGATLEYYLATQLNIAVIYQ